MVLPGQEPAADLCEQLRACRFVSVASLLLTSDLDLRQVLSEEQTNLPALFAQAARDVGPFLELFIAELKQEAAALSEEQAFDKDHLLRRYPYDDGEESSDDDRGYDPVDQQDLAHRSVQLDGEPSKKLYDSCYSRRPGFFVQQLTVLVKKYGVAGSFVLMDCLAVHAMSVKQQIALARQGCCRLDRPSEAIGIMQLLLSLVGGTSFLSLFLHDDFWQLRFHYLAILIDAGVVTQLLDEYEMMILANYLLCKREIKLFRQLMMKKNGEPTALDCTHFFERNCSETVARYQQHLPLVTALQYEGNGFSVATNPFFLLAASFGYEQQLVIGDRENNTALMHAAKIGNHEALGIILSSEIIDLLHQNNEGKTAFFLAAEQGRLRCLRLMHAKGEEMDEGLLKSLINYPDHKEHTPLMAALLLHQYDCVNYLLSCPGIDYAFMNERGESAIVYALLRNDTYILSRFFVLMQSKEMSLENSCLLADSQAALLIDQLEKIVLTCSKNIIPALPICRQLFQLQTIQALLQKPYLKTRFRAVIEELFLAAVCSGDDGGSLYEVASFCSRFYDGPSGCDALPFITIFFDHLARYPNTLFSHRKKLVSVCKMLIARLHDSLTSQVVAPKLVLERSQDLDIQTVKRDHKYLQNRVPALCNIVSAWAQKGFIDYEEGLSALVKMSPLIPALMLGLPSEIIEIFLDNDFVGQQGYFKQGYSLLSLAILAHDVLGNRDADSYLLKILIDRYGPALEPDATGHNALYYLDHLQRYSVQNNFFEIYNRLRLAAVQAERAALEEKRKKRAFDEQAKRDEEIDTLIEEFGTL